MREQAFYAACHVTSWLAASPSSSRSATTRNARSVSSGEPLAFKLPKRLPELPKEPDEPKDAEQTAMNMRLDVC